MEKRIFALKDLKVRSGLSGGTLQLKTSVLVRKRRHGKERRHVKVKAEIGVMQPQAKDYLEPPEKARKDSSLEPPERG